MARPADLIYPDRAVRTFVTAMGLYFFVVRLTGIRWPHRSTDRRAPPAVLSPLVVREETWSR